MCTALPKLSVAKVWTCASMPDPRISGQELRWDHRTICFSFGGQRGVSGGGVQTSCTRMANGLRSQQANAYGVRLPR